MRALSHGNQQRVQLIAALLNDPELLVLDEPFSGLDPLAMAAMAQLLGDVARSGATVLFSSHQPDMVQDPCENVVIIDHGRVVLAGDLDDLRASSPERVVEVRWHGHPPDWTGVAPVEVLHSSDGLSRLRVNLSTPRRARLSDRPSTSPTYGGGW